MLTANQFTPYNKLHFSCKGSHLNDLGIFRRLAYQIYRTILDILNFTPKDFINCAKFFSFKRPKAN